MALAFNMGSQARLAASIVIADTRILLTSYDTMLDKGGSGDSYYAQMINAEGDKEIVLVDVGNSDAVQGLSVTRGVESTSARDWGGGTIIWQVMSESSFDLLKQNSVDRQVAFNPDGVLVSDYIGEKVYQLTLNLWWKAVAAGTTEWRLIAGEMFVADVIFAPAAGAVAPGTTLTMTCASSNTSIYYTADGTDPDETDTLYTSPVLVPDPGPTTFKAKAFGGERYEQPSVNITSGEYTITAQNWWTDKSMATAGGSKIIYSTSNASLLSYDATALYERVGLSWGLVVAAYGAYESRFILEDGSTIYGLTSNNRMISTNTTSFPVWSVHVSPINTILNGYVTALHHIVNFGGSIYINVQSSQVGNLDTGLYLVSAVDTVSLYSSFSPGTFEVRITSSPVESNGYLYGMVRDSIGGWDGNLLRMNSGTATRLTTTDDDVWGLFSYDGDLYGWGTDATGDYVQIKRFNGTSWVVTKSVYGGTTAKVFYDTTITVGGVFFNTESVNSDLWRWNPAGDALENVASNITDTHLVVLAYLKQSIAWDPLDAPATMWMTPPGSAKTWSWEEV